MGEHIVILGGGFGGWYAARALAPRLRSGHRVTLIDRVDHMLYTPMLTEVAGGNIAANDIAVPMKALPRRVRFVRAEVRSVDAAAKTVTLANGEVLQATQIVFALGATTAYHGIEGAQEGSVPLKTLNDASRVLSRVDELVDQAAKCADEGRRRELLTLIVAGGGYTGVETMAAVAEHVRRRARSAGVRAQEVRAVLIEPEDRLMRETPASLAQYSQGLLERQGIRVMLKTGVKSVEGEVVSLSNGEQIRAGLLIWDTGIEPSPLLREVQVPRGRHGGVVVDACFRVQGMRGVWAIGDCAEIPQKGGGSYAATAQNATREGVQLAQNISAVLRGDAPQPFRYTMLGQLALLSDRKAVAEILGVKVRGLLAWALWWAIYTVKLPWMRGRAGVLKELTSGFQGKEVGMRALPSPVRPSGAS